VQRLTAAALLVETGGDPGAVLERAGRAGVLPVDVLDTARRHRVTELLHAHADDLDLAGLFGRELVDRLAADHATTVRGVAIQVLELGRVLRAFDEAGIAVLALKGPALAVQTAGTGTARGYGDLDLFVDPATVESAQEVLIAHGWEPRTFGSAPPGTWAWRHLLRTFNEIAFDGRASSVDLHWRLDPTPAALPYFPHAWARRELVSLDGLPAGVPTLARQDAFVHSCWHAAKDEWRWLRSLVDVHRLARQPEVWARWTDRRAELGTRPVRNTLALTEGVLGLPAAVPVELRRRRAARPVVRRARARQLHEPTSRHPLPAAQSLRDLRHRLTAARRPRAVALAVAAVAAPAPSLAGIEDRSAWTAVPKLALKRIGWLLAQSVRWVLRPARPSTGAGSGEQVVGSSPDRSKALT
jgi:hypothetical protein